VPSDVERVVQAVADEIKGDHREHDHQAWPIAVLLHKV
jgi:hypothetical protein